MLKIRNLLLALDFTSSDDEALLHALDLAERFGSTLHVMHANVLRGEPFSKDIDTSTPEKVRTRIKEIVGPQALRKRGYEPEDLDIIIAVERNIEPAPAILEYAEDHDIDCLILGTRGRSGVRRLLIGSVAEEVVRMAPCPVLTVRQGAADRTRAPKTIMVPVDFSEHSRQAVKYGRELASLYGARLVLTHVIEEFLHPAFYGPAVQSIYDVEPDIEEKAREHLKAFYEDSSGPETEVSYVVAAGRAGRKVSEVAEEESVDLLVMSTHGRTGMEEFLIGSVANRVIRSAPCPVLSVKPSGKSLLERNEK